MVLVDIEIVGENVVVREGSSSGHNSLKDGGKSWAWFSASFLVVACVWKWSEGPIIEIHGYYSDDIRIKVLELVSILIKSFSSGIYLSDSTYFYTNFLKVLNAMKELNQSEDVYYMARGTAYYVSRMRKISLVTRCACL